MSKKRKIWSELNKFRILIKKHGLLDIYLFGSFARGNYEAKDVDVCLIIKDTDEKRILELNSLASKYAADIGLKAHISILTEREFIQGSTMAKTLFEEGISLLEKKPLSDIWGYAAESEFIYSLKKFSPTKRVKFHYALNGRYGRRGILQDVHGKILANGIITVAIHYEDVFKTFLDTWDADYKVKRILS